MYHAFENDVFLAKRKSLMRDKVNPLVYETATQDIRAQKRIGLKLTIGWAIGSNKGKRKSCMTIGTSVMGKLKATFNAAAVGGLLSASTSSICLTGGLHHNAPVIQ